MKLTKKQKELLIKNLDKYPPKESPNPNPNPKPYKHESIKPGHMQARNCSAEYWFK